MNKINNSILFTGDKFIRIRIIFKITRIYLQHLTGDFNYIYKSKLNNACLAYDAEYADGKDFSKRIISDKNLKDKYHEIAINPKHDACQRGLARMVYETFDEEVRLSVNVIKLAAEELHKRVTKKFKKGKPVLQSLTKYLRLTPYFI